MQEQVLEKPQVQPEQSESHAKDEVGIKINNVDYSVHRGRISVVELKKISGVPQADVMEQLLEGKLVDLEDNGFVTIKGREVFISHPRDSASS